MRWLVVLRLKLAAWSQKLDDPCAECAESLDGACDAHYFQGDPW